MVGLEHGDESAATSNLGPLGVASVAVSHDAPVVRLFRCARWIGRLRATDEGAIQLQRARTASVAKRSVDYTIVSGSLDTKRRTGTPLPAARSIHAYVARALARSVAQAVGSAKQPDQQRREHRFLTSTLWREGF